VRQSSTREARGLTYGARKAEYLKIIASLVSKEFNINSDGHEVLSDEALLDALDQVRAWQR
jgi:hypothetical protein